LFGSFCFGFGLACSRLTRPYAAHAHASQADSQGSGGKSLSRCLAASLVHVAGLGLFDQKSAIAVAMLIAAAAAFKFCIRHRKKRAPGWFVSRWKLGFGIFD
jgi:hypothetical protein